MNPNPIQKKFFFALKMGSIGFLMLILLIPMVMIESVIRERKDHQFQAQDETISTWGYPQTLTGPVLIIPYQVRKVVQENEKNKTYIEKARAYFLPENISIQSKVVPEIRYRGIYKVPVYQTEMQVKGDFAKLDFSRWKIDPADILWEEAILVFGISDVRAIREANPVKLSNTENLPFEPMAEESEIISSGLKVLLGKRSLLFQNQPVEFNYSLKFAGSKQINFIPVGKQSKISIDSPWVNPSFVGAYLPEHRTISEQGFTAEWNVLHLGRGYPQQWLNKEVAEGLLQRSALGVSFMIPVDIYVQATRAAKYAILFIALTYLILLLFELVGRVPLNFLHYLLVGSSLCIFYLLLIATSEFIPFVFSYLIAMISIVGLNFIYTKRVMGKWSHSLGVSLLLTVLYGFLYLLLSSQDSSLLVGAWGLFLILAIVMFMTSKLNWDSLILKKNNSTES